jgi:hypothetical protein
MSSTLILILSFAKIRYSIFEKNKKFLTFYMFLGKEHKNAMVVSAILFMLFVIRRIVCINSLYII